MTITDSERGGVKGDLGQDCMPEVSGVNERFPNLQPGQGTADVQSTVRYSIEQRRNSVTLGNTNDSWCLSRAEPMRLLDQIMRGSNGHEAIISHTAVYIRIRPGYAFLGPFSISTYVTLGSMPITPPVDSRVSKPKRECML